MLVVGAFVPFEPQPSQVVNQLGGKLRPLTAIVQVLDAQHDAAALAAGRKPRAQTAEHVAQVHAARGRRGEASHDGGGLCRCRCVRGVCCYVACVDIHADEYSAGGGGGTGSTARSPPASPTPQTTETPAALRNCRGFRGKGGHDPQANGKGANRVRSTALCPLARGLNQCACGNTKPLHL